MKVFITRNILNPALELLEQAGIETKVWRDKRQLSSEELIEHCKDCDALIVAGNTRLSGRFLEACRHLKVIALHSVGYDHVDIQTATRLKIPVGNAPGVVSNATADIAFLLMLAVSRKAFYMHNQIIAGQWTFLDPTANLGIELRNKTLGIFGLGNIGYQMARLCKSAYNMATIYCNRQRNEKAEKDLNAKKVTFDDLLAKSDVLSVHCNLTTETRNKFNSDAFSKMKPSSIFINSARGGIHDEKDLIQALENKNIWGAGLDVTNPEPMDKNNPLLYMPTVAVLPHIGTATEETRKATGERAAENIIAGLSGQKLPFIINPEVYNQAIQQSF